jgi:hypothetical protein
MLMSFNRRQFLMAAGGGAASLAANPWEELIQGDSLAGWKAEGQADWRVEHGVLIGRQGTGGAAGDLFTEKKWTGLELECEWRMRWPGNSGIWFRYMGPKTGYQADFLDEPQAYPDALSGSLYCMGKAFIAKNRDASSIHKDDWNRLSSRAAADRIAIGMNGRTVVDVRDSTFAGPGSVGVQVHAGKAFADMEVRVRNLRVRAL